MILSFWLPLRMRVISKVVGLRRVTNMAFASRHISPLVSLVGEYEQTEQIFPVYKV